MSLTDVTPLDEPELSPGGSQSPDKKPKPSGWMNKAADFLKGDDGISRLQKEKQQIADRAAREQADIDRQILEKERHAYEDAKAKDPAVIAENKRLADLYKGETLQSRRLAKLIELADEGIRRKVPDERLVEWCRNQLARNHMFGGIFTSPEKE